MTPVTDTLAEKRRILQLETLYDLALALNAQRPEQELVDELLQRVCAVLDPAAAVSVTRDAFGQPRAVSAVGWTPSAPPGTALLGDRLWQQLLREGGLMTRRKGQFAGRDFDELLITPLASRGIYLGLLAVLDKETRGGENPSFSEDDRRFLDSVAALAGAVLDGARQVEQLEAQREKLTEENRALKERFSESLDGRRIIAHAPALRRVLDIVERVAPRSVSVLVRGESGTGKELVAKLLHHRSGREGPLITLNCAAMPESLLESELFGIEGGVATGVNARAGQFELADGGTLLLDEIGDMQPSIQVKLLRTLQEREIVRVGGQGPIPVDVRLVAATHRNLQEMVREGLFREDLFYRLKGVDVELPPLRERRQDIPHLVRYFAEDFALREEIAQVPFSAEALSVLMAHSYPGNVRELQNAIEGALSLAEGEVDGALVRSLLAIDGVDAGAGAVDGSEVVELADAERIHIERILRQTKGNKTVAARLLGINRRTLVRKGF